MTTGPRWLAALAVAGLLLTGCSAADSAAKSTSSGTHTMADGSKMSDKDMMESAAKPSEAAAMVCSAEIEDHLVTVLGLDSPPKHTSTWANKIFTCTYQLKGGPLSLSVDDATDAATGKSHFDELKKNTEGARDFTGMLGLGLPSFETAAGSVAFLKDGKTLLVDATKLPTESGSKAALSRSDLAYSVATAVVACWSE